MLGKGLISAEDFSIFSITRNEDEAIEVIRQFYRNFHSLRFVEGKLIIRLNKELSNENIMELENEFPDLRMPGKKIERTGPYPEESDEPDLLSLPRLAMHFNHKHYGLLMAFIGRINTF